MKKLGLLLRRTVAFPSLAGLVLGLLLAGCARRDAPAPEAVPKEGAESPVPSSGTGSAVDASDSGSSEVAVPAAVSDASTSVAGSGGSNGTPATESRIPAADTPLVSVE